MFEKRRLLPAYMVIVLLVVIGAGCATTTKKHPGIGIGDINLDDLARDEYTILDTVEGTGKVTQILLLRFPLSQKLGYTTWASGSENPLVARVGGLRAESKAKAMALHDALSRVPNADVVLPMSTTVEKSGLPFLFRVYTATVKGKAIKVKTDEDLISP